MFKELPPKTSFVFGIVAALAVIGLISFLVLVGVFLKGGLPVSNNTAADETTSTSNPPQEPNQLEIVMRPVTEDDHILGNKNAAITLVEYSDLECPYCKYFYLETKKLLEAYPNDMRLVFRHYPLTSLHSKAKKEAEAAECAAEQGKFWEYLDKIFEVTPSNNGLSLDDLPKLAQEIGLNKPKFEKCLEDGKYITRVEADIDDANTVSNNAQSTPLSVFITSKGEKFAIPGYVSFEQLKEIMETLLSL